MKTISSAAFLASLTAGLLLLPLEVVGYFLLVTAIGSIWALDYTPRRSLRFEVTQSRRTAREVFSKSGARRTFRAPALSSESNRLAA